jgi:hypothetical protein
MLAPPCTKEGESPSSNRAWDRERKRIRLRVHEREDKAKEREMSGPEYTSQLY